MMAKAPGSRSTGLPIIAGPFSNLLHFLGSPFSPGKTGLWGGDRPGHVSPRRSLMDGPGVCRLTKVCSCAPLLFEGCASSGMEQLLLRNIPGYL